MQHREADTNELIDILTNLSSRGTKKTHTNVLRGFHDRGVLKQPAEDIINYATENNIITTYMYAKQLSYKISTPPAEHDVPDEVPVEIIDIPDLQELPVELPGEVPVSRGEFEEYKQSIADIINSLADTYQGEIASLRVELSQLKDANVKTTTSIPSDTKFLQDTIQSLIQKLPDTVPSTTGPPPANSIAPPISSSGAPPSNTTKPAPVSKKHHETSAQNQQPKTPPPKRKRVEIIGDSMLSGLWSWSRPNYQTKIHAYGGATTEDMSDMVEMALRREPDVLIIHSGTNDFDHNVQTKSQLQRIIAKARGKNADIQIGVSAICHREDKRNLQAKIKDMNNQLKTFCGQNQVAYIDHEDFDHSCLSAGKLHPNRNGNKSLYMDFQRTIDSLVLEN